MKIDIEAGYARAMRRFPRIIARLADGVPPPAQPIDKQRQEQIKKSGTRR